MMDTKQLHEYTIAELESELEYRKQRESEVEVLVKDSIQLLKLLGPEWRLKLHKIINDEQGWSYFKGALKNEITKDASAYDP